MFRSLLPAAVVATLMLHASVVSAGSAKPGEVRVHARNSQLFSKVENGTFCYAKATNPQLAPGRIVKRTLRRRVSGLKVSRRYFVPLRNTINDRLAKYRRAHRSDRRRQRQMKQRLESVLLAKTGLCAGYIQTASAGPAATSPSGTGSAGGTVSFGGSAGIGSFLRLRWFPSDHAISYFVYIVRADGAVVSKEAATPSGCTLLLTRGYTSGLCSYQIDSYRLPLGYTVLISAANSSGESPVSRF